MSDVVGRIVNALLWLMVVATAVGFLVVPIIYLWRWLA